MVSTPGQVKSFVDVRCPHCGEMNPSTAYCCLTCMKPMNPSKHVPLWKRRVRPSVAVVTISVVLVGAGFWVMKRWLATVEAQMTINVKTAEYNLSLVADKRIRQFDIEATEGDVSENPETAP